MLAEFTTLQERAAHLEQVKSTQVNFFLIMVAAIIAGVSGFSNLSTFQAYIPYSIFVASLLIFLLGFATLYQSVNYSMSIVSFYRRAGRIRRWFVNIDKDLAPYVAFPAGDDRPKFKLTRSYLAFLCHGFRRSENRIAHFVKYGNSQFAHFLGMMEVE